MKKLTLYLIFTMMICGTFTTSCTTEDDYFTEDAAEAKLQDLKTRILQIAAEYGENEIEIDENILRNNLNLSDKQIEQSIKMLAYLEGTFALEKGKDGKIHSRRIVKQMSATRSINDRGYESRSGDYSDEQLLNNDLRVKYNFDYEYNQGNNDEFKPDFNLAYREKDEDGNYTGEWIQYETISKDEFLNTTFSGDINNLEITYTYRITIRDPKTGTIITMILNGTYSSGSGRGSIYAHK